MDPPQQRPESPMEIPMDQQGRRSETPPPRPRPAPAAAAGGDFSAIITVFFLFILIFSFVTFYFSSVASIFFIFIFLFLCFWSSLLKSNHFLFFLFVIKFPSACLAWFFFFCVDYGWSFIIAFWSFNLECFPCLINFSAAVISCHRSSQLLGF